MFFFPTLIWNLMGTPIFTLIPSQFSPPAALCSAVDGLLVHFNQPPCTTMPGSQSCCCCQPCYPLCYTVSSYYSHTPQNITPQFIISRSPRIPSSPPSPASRGSGGGGSSTPHSFSSHSWHNDPCLHGTQTPKHIIFIMHKAWKCYSQTHKKSFLLQL